MNAKEFHDAQGPKVVRQMRDKIGLCLQSWYHIKNGVHGVSVNKAIELAKASEEVAPGEGMKIVDLLGLRDLPAYLVGSGKDEK